MIFTECLLCKKHKMSRTQGGPYSWIKRTSLWVYHFSNSKSWRYKRPGLSHSILVLFLFKWWSLSPRGCIISADFKDDVPADVSGEGEGGLVLAYWFYKIFLKDACDFIVHRSRDKAIGLFFFNFKPKCPKQEMHWFCPVTTKHVRQFRFETCGIRR